MEEVLKVFSVYNGSGIDGKGLRCVVFLHGCNLRCPFCHNPECFTSDKFQSITVPELLTKIKRYSSYIKNGGVTVSGGEPFLQAEAVASLFISLKQNNIHTLVETNGTLFDKKLIDVCDSFIVDVKNYENIFPSTLEFIDYLKKTGKEFQLTNVLVPNLNDGEQHLLTLAKALKQNVKFLPFKKLCEEKYNNLNIPFAYSYLKEATKDDVLRAEKIFNAFLEKI